MPKTIEEIMEEKKKLLRSNAVFTLDLSGSSRKAEAKIKDEHITELAPLLGSHANLEELDVSDNLITDNGAVCLAQALSGHTKLLRINLRGNKIGPRGAAAFALTLKSKSPLLVIDFQNNCIGDTGAKAFALALPSNETLTRLLLNDNGITVAGANTLIDALRNNYVLYDLSLGSQLLKTNQQEGNIIINKIVQRKNAVEKAVNTFLEACEKGDITTLQKYLQVPSEEKRLSPVSEGAINRVSVQCADEKGNTGLHRAVKAKQVKVVDFLLRHGAILMRNRELPLREERKREEERLGHRQPQTRREYRMHYMLGYDPLDIAEEHGFIEIIGILKNRPSAFVPIASQIRELIESGQGETSVDKNTLLAIRNDVEINNQALANVLTARDQCLTAELTGTKEDLELANKKIEVLAMQVELLQSQNPDAARALFIVRFKQDNNIIIFYRTVQHQLSNIFSAIRTISSGFVAHQRHGDVATVASGIALLGNLVSLVPMVGDKVATATGIISGKLQEVDYAQQLNIIKAMSLMLLDDEQKAASEGVARLLGQRFSAQLVLLNSIQQTKEVLKREREEAGFFKKMIGNVMASKEKADEFIYKATPKSGAEMVAEYAVLRILEALQHKAIQVPGMPGSTETLPVEEQFFRAVVHIPARAEAGITLNPLRLLDKIKDKISDLLGVEDLTTKDPEKRWKLKEFFTRPGIQIENTCYILPECDARVYGYREGTVEEVNRNGYQKEVRGNAQLLEVTAPANAGRTQISPARRVVEQTVSVPPPPSHNVPITSTAPMPPATHFNPPTLESRVYPLSPTPAPTYAGSPSYGQLLSPASLAAQQKGPVFKSPPSPTRDPRLGPPPSSGSKPITNKQQPFNPPRNT